MPQIILGIDVGSYSVKVAKIERTFSAFEFVDFQERKIQYNELLSPEESVSAALQGLLDDTGWKGDQVICGYPGHKISSRVLTLPFGSLSKVDQAMEFELENYIPFELEKVVFDYHILHSTKESSEVMAFYTLKEEFAHWLKNLSACGVDPKIVTAEGVEYLNLVSLGMVPPETPYAILDIGHTKTNLTVCHGKELSLIRSISIGGKHITEAIQKKLDIPYEEAERLKIEVGGIRFDETEEIDDLTAKVYEAIQQKLDEMLVSIRQAFFAHRERMSDPVGGIYLCGGSSRIPKCDRYLSQRLKQNVTHIDCTTFHFTKLAKATVHRSIIPQALALGLRGMAAAKLPALNFRQEEFAFKGDVEKIGGTFRYAGIALGMIFLLGVSYFGIKYYLLKQRLDALNAEIVQEVETALADTARKITSPANAQKTLKTEERQMQDRIKKLREIYGVSTLDILKEISTAVPSRKDIRLDIENFSFKKDSITFQGRVDSFVAVDQIKTGLEQSSWFTKVTPGNVQKGVSEAEVKFKMTMDLASKKEEKK